VLPVAFGIKLCGSIPNVGIILSAAQVVRSVLAVDFGNKLGVSGPYIGIYLSAAQGV